MLTSFALVAVFGLAACGDDDDETGTATGVPVATRTAIAPTPGEGLLTVPEALDIEDDTETTVSGFLVVAASGQAFLCEELAESFLPQCGDDALGVLNLVLSNVEDVRSADDAPGLFWTEAPVVLIGRVQPVYQADAQGGVRQNGAVLVVDPGSPEGAIPTTGVAEIDNVVRRVLLRGGASLEDVVTYAVVECTQQRFAGEPPHCADTGVPAGTTFETLPVSSCEGSYVIKPQIRGFLDGMFGSRGPLLDFHGAFVPARHPFGEGRPTPDYAVMFLPRGAAQQQGYRALYLDDGRVVFALSSCGEQTPRDDEVARWLVRPPN